MRCSERKLIVVYVMLPLLVLSFSLGALMLFTDSGSNYSNLKLSRAFSTLAAKPVSLMSPETSGDLYNEMNSVRDDFVEYNEDYGDRLSINVATGSAATLAKMKTFISTTERTHLSGHGTWNSAEGPKITMYGDDLNEQAVSSWTLTGGMCKVLYLSACNSMGHSGILDTRLAYKLLDRTSIEAVVGFKDVANVVAATLMSQSFWGYHVTLTSSGGISTDASYTQTVDRIQFRIDFIRFAGELGIGVLLGLLIQSALSGWGVVFVEELLSAITTMAALYLLVDAMQATLNVWELMGTSVPGLYWYTGGGGGSGKPPVELPY